jgi:hypothetical protein
MSGRISFFADLVNACSPCSHVASCSGGSESTVDQIVDRVDLLAGFQPECQTSLVGRIDGEISTGTISAANLPAACLRELCFVAAM